MSSKPIKLIQPLYEILIEEQLDGFSVLELRDRYIALCDLTLDKSVARQLVYRNIRRLVDKKLLRKVSIKGSHKVMYQKTDLFSKIHWKLSEKHQWTESHSRVTAFCENNSTSPKLVLANRLEKCESDFLACLHEIKVYQGLSFEFPHLKESLHEVRSKTKIQSSKLVGEIRAIKIALALS